MEDQKIAWAKYEVDDYEQNIYYKDLDADLYNQKYRGKLTCINGCKAKIKFTQKLDDNKFFSTWNKEGSLHEIDCPYHIDYNNEIGRRKLAELYEAVSLTDEHIMNTLKYKFRSLKPKETDHGDDKKKTRTVINTGEDSFGKYIDNGEVSETAQGRIRIGTLDAKYMTMDYVNLRKCVYGIVKSTYLGNSVSGSKYLYINLYCKDTNLSVYFPEAFYSKTNNNVDLLDRFYSNLNEAIRSGKQLIFAGVGFIKQNSSGKGLNVIILDKNHFMLNETSYDMIVSGSGIKDMEYIYL